MDTVAVALFVNSAKSKGRENWAFLPSFKQSWCKPSKLVLHSPLNIKEIDLDEESKSHDDIHISEKSVQTTQHKK